MNEIAYKAAKETVQATQKEFTATVESVVIPKTVKHVMTNLGVDVSNPQESQADFLYLRNQRKKAEKIQEYKMRAFISGVVGVVIAALVAYFKG